MDVLKYIFIIVGGYLLGSVSISIILSRMLGTDVRKKGSGNAGATNMARTFGLLAGFATLAGDFLKAVIVMFVGYRLCGDWGLMAGGMACTTGHCFPIFYGFRGGNFRRRPPSARFARPWPSWSSRLSSPCRCRGCCWRSTPRRSRSSSTAPISSVCPRAPSPTSRPRTGNEPEKPKGTRRVPFLFPPHLQRQRLDGIMKQCREPAPLQSALRPTAPPKGGACMERRL